MTDHATASAHKAADHRAAWVAGYMRRAIERAKTAYEPASLPELKAAGEREWDKKHPAIVARAEAVA